MILIGLGANLPSVRFGAPMETLKAALDELESHGVRVVRRSRWYSSAPVPPSGQARYINAVAAVETEISTAAFQYVTTLAKLLALTGETYKFIDYQRQGRQVSARPRLADQTQMAKLELAGR